MEGDTQETKGALYPYVLTLKVEDFESKHMNKVHLLFPVCLFPPSSTHLSWILEHYWTEQNYQMMYFNGHCAHFYTL